ncbi:metal ABC transporter substrate-binding protein [Actinobaculum suis]|uniref:metal ABC transporter substrate-binding protein n=1 Tax=Actinobaculum suis TaxID=1657 RepID=UPI001C4013B6|nr:zinc ABC transporter substrate-binding protein [Actinobaculum suis]
MRFIRALFAMALALVFTVTGCSSQPNESSEGKPVVYASFYPVYDMVSTVAGDTLDVRIFMPADKDPHMWEPTPKDMKELAQADLLVVNGANFEPWLDQVQSAIPDLEVLRLSDYIDLINYKGAAAIGEFQYLARPGFEGGKEYSIIFGHTHEKHMRVAFYKNDDGLEGQALIDKCKELMRDEGPEVTQDNSPTVESGKVMKIKMGHEAGQLDFTIPDDGDWIFIADRISEQLLPYTLADSGGHTIEPEVLMDNASSATDKITYDPHSWLSLVNAKSYVNAINDTLRKKYPEHEDVYAKNKFDLVSSMTEVHNEYKIKMRDLEHREFVVSHNAYEYLARDFELIQYPLQGLTSMNQPSIRTLTNAIRYVRDNDVEYIFYELGSLPYGADTVAAEVDAELLPLASMEYVTKEQGEKYGGYVGLMRMNLENLYVSLVR